MSKLKKLYEDEDSVVVLTPYGRMTVVLHNIKERIRQGRRVFPHNHFVNMGYQSGVDECLKIIASELKKVRRHKDKINRT